MCVYSLCKMNCILFFANFFRKKKMEIFGNIWKYLEIKKTPKKPNCNKK